MIPQVSLPRFGAIQVIEECLCSMSMEVWYNDNATPVWSTRRLLVRDYEFRAYDLHAYDTLSVSTEI